MDKISIVIPTLNSGKTLNECLETLRKLASEASIDTELMIVDSGSTDNTLQIAKVHAAEIVVSPGVSRGTARNIGAKKVKNDVMIFLDSDCIVTPEWFSSLRSMTFDFNTTIVSGPAILFDPQNFVGTAARDLLSDPLFTLSSYTFSFGNEIKEVRDVPSSNIAVSRTLFEKIGGFPDWNFNEDSLFCQSVVKNGGRIIYLPQFKTMHKRTFESVTQFGHYFYQYGYNYSKDLCYHRNLMNRYAGAVAFFTLLVIGSAAFIFIGVFNLWYFFAVAISYFVITSAYSFLRTRRRTALAIPFLFLVLVFSYVSGFFYGGLIGIVQ
jgi:glycosyltransferase involved in cell wall biosynthesis